MNRIIKFEYGFESVNGIVKKVYHLHDIPFIKEKCDVWSLLPFKYFRQFTGLKDKNGVDIYEGDILTPTTYNGSNMAGFKCEVVFKKGMFCFKQNGVLIQSDTPLCNSLYFGDKHGNKFEIIGNIYENTELLPCPHTTDLK